MLYDLCPMSTGRFGDVCLGRLKDNQYVAKVVGFLTP